MRQAGRYLPAYRKVREGVSFLEMCRDVDRAVEVSLQPIEHVGTEAVILFSDIFVPIPGMGVELDFAPGPIIAQPLRTREQVEALQIPDCRESVPYVFEILARLRQELESRQIPLLGFAGAPFTLAAYLVEGSGSRDFSTLKRLMHREPETLELLLDHLATLVTDYLRAQVEAGAQVVQLFDTWAGITFFFGLPALGAALAPAHRRRSCGSGGAPDSLCEQQRPSCRLDGRFRRRCHFVGLALRSGGGRGARWGSRELAGQSGPLRVVGSLAEDPLHGRGVG